MVLPFTRWMRQAVAADSGAVSSAQRFVAGVTVLILGRLRRTLKSDATKPTVAGTKARDGGRNARADRIEPHRRGRSAVRSARDRPVAFQSVGSNPAVDFSTDLCKILRLCDESLAPPPVGPIRFGVCAPGSTIHREAEFRRHRFSGVSPGVGDGERRRHPEYRVRVPLSARHCR